MNEPISYPDMQALRAPFPREQVQSRKGGGGNYAYIRYEDIVRRLNEHAGAWSLQVINEYDDILVGRTGEDIRVKCAIVRLTIPGHGSREQKGVQVVANGGGEDLLKAAISDGLKKAAELFGVGLRTYEEEDHGGGSVTTSRDSGGGQGEEYAENRATPPPQQPAQQPRAAQQPAAAVGNPNVCVDCGAGLTPGQSIMSMKKFGRPLCITDQKGATPIS